MSDGAAEVATLRPFLAVLVPALVVVAVALADERPTLREGVSLVGSLATFAVVASMLPGVLEGRVYVTHLGTFATGIEFAFRADPLGMLFGAVASALWIPTAIYSAGYLRGHEKAHQTRFFAALALSIAAAMGVAFAANLLVLVLFYELMTIGTYPLVAHDGTERARRVGYKYLAYVLGGGTLAVGGTLLVFWLAGTATFAPGGIDSLADAASENPWLARIAFGLLAAGFGVKAAIMPLHGWLPSAMVAPTPVSGLLHAVAVVKSGAFALARVVLEVYGPATTEALRLAAPLAGVAAATILLGSLLALRQDDLKRRLAYSTIAQLSFIVLGIALLTPSAVVGGLVHLPVHAVGKLTLFFCAGALAVECGTKKVSEMAGIGRRMPLTMVAFAVGAASLASIPLFAGFVSKWHLLLGSAEADNGLVLALFVVSGGLNVAYFWPIVYAAFFEDADPDPKPIVEEPMGGTRTDGGAKSEPTDASTAAIRAQGDGGPTVGAEWERRTPTGAETTWLLLGPILAVGALVVAVGIAADWLFVLEAARMAAESAGVSRP